MLKSATFEDKKVLSQTLNDDPVGMTYVAFYSDIEAWNKRDTENNTTYVFYTEGSEPQVAGFVTIQRLSDTGDFILEYYISPNHRGNRYGQKAIKELISLLRSQNKACMLFAYVNPINKTSSKVLDETGFMLQGRSGEWNLYSYIVQ